MSSTMAKPADAISAAPTFSYAQAAKGRTPSSTASAIQSSQATSGVSTPAKEVVSTTSTPSASVNGTTSSDVGERNGVHDVISKEDPLGVGIDMETKSKPQSVSEPLADSPSFGTTSTSSLSKEEIPATTGSASDAVWERGSRFEPSTPGTDKSDSNEGRRGKKGKKQKNAEKEPEKEKEEVKPEILVAAPPPTVNIWMQRKEAQAQATKTKPSPSISQTPQTADARIASEAAAGQVPKSADTRRRAKGGEDEVKPVGATQNGSPTKDTANSAKSQKKGADALAKPKDDATKRSSRGSRPTEKDEKVPTTQLPPPVEDAMSWPTPETALEEKRKAQEKSEKEEKDESSTNKPRTKEKWVTVPYVPSVNFNTPLPTRGGRGRGGGRGGRETNGRGSHASGAEAVGENLMSAAGTTKEVETRGRGDSSGSRATSLPPNSSKPNGTRERKSPATSTVERAKPQAGNSAKGQSAASAVPPQFENFGDSNQIQHPVRGDNSKKVDQLQASSNESNSKSAPVDRRESSVRGSEPLRDGAMSKENGQVRDRADGQANRGRGGLRGGRGNHNYPNNQNPLHAYTNGHAAQPPNGFPLRHNSNPYSSPIQQGPFNNQFTQPPSRGRGGSRSQSIPNAGMYGRGGYPDMRQMPQLQTTNQFMDMQPGQSMSAASYNPFNMEHYSVLAMVTMQLEYYFSIDNLCKDVFLRKHMDTQGFVFLAFIAGFKRIQALTQDFELLRFACQESRVIDIIQGEDGIDRVRRKEGYEKWVLVVEERDESVRNSGPKYHHRQPPRSQYMGQMGPPGNQAMSPPPFSPNGTESHFALYPNETPIPPNMNGNGTSHHLDTPLSATVPDFAPGLPTMNGNSDSLEEETFSDAEIAALVLVMTPSFSPPPYAASRTFSNGSIDGSSIAEELQERQSRTLTNGSLVSETSPDELLRSRSPFAPLSPTSTSASSAPRIMWAKGQRNAQPSDNEKYTEVRARALRNRDSTASPEVHHDMKVLYEFWAHFLVRNFNRTMYTEFRKCAFDDAQRNSLTGLEQLGRFYDAVLKKPRVMSDTLAVHYIELVKNEKGNTEAKGQSPAFIKLRAAWRNGALDMKSRKKIDKLVDAKLKEELER